MANQKLNMAQNIRSAPSSSTLMGVAHARMANETFPVTTDLKKRLFEISDCDPEY